MLAQFKRTMAPLLNEYTVYTIGRRPDLPAGYHFDKMARDYAEMIRNEIKVAVDITGTSTGGQICQYLAADHPDIVRKVVLLSSAYRLSEQGVRIERESADWFVKGKVEKCLVALMKGMYQPGISRTLFLFFTSLFGKLMIGKIQHPNDFLIEVEADRVMNFKDRLGEIKAPTLIISGEQDQFYSAKDVEDTAACIPNSTLKFYPGYGHNLTMSNMKRVVEDMRAFLLRE